MEDQHLILSDTGRCLHNCRFPMVQETDFLHVYWHTNLATSLGRCGVCVNACNSNCGLLIFFGRARRQKNVQKQKSPCILFGQVDV